MQEQRAPVIEIHNLLTQFGSTVVLNNLDLTVYQGEILGIVGGSGSGKTTLLRDIIMLHQPTSGSIKICGVELCDNTASEIDRLRKRWGMMFQQGALFSSLTILENVCFPLKEFTHLNNTLREEIAMIKLDMARFPLDSVQKYPAEISGGMLKRAALARAIAMDPELLFLDEPTAGLDPISAGALDELVLNLQQSLGLTIVIVTHDLDTLWRVTDRVAFLGEKKVIAVEPIEKLANSTHPLIKDYFSGSRMHRKAEEKASGN